MNTTFIFSQSEFGCVITGSNCETVDDLISIQAKFLSSLNEDMVNEIINNL